MRFSGIFSGILGGAALAMSIGLMGCGDDKPGAIANEDLQWSLGCTSEGGCTSFRLHAQSEERPFEVSCERLGPAIKITLRDPGSPGDTVTGKLAMPPSIITINNGQPGVSCDVTVQESTEYGFALETITGACADQGCAFTGAFDQGGWDFVGELSCGRMKKQNAMAHRGVYTLGSTSSGGPIKISVDNCN